MDPLSEVLSLLSTRSSRFSGLKAGGDWAIQFAPPGGIKFNVVVQGACWLMAQGLEHPIGLEAGDGFLVCGPHAFSLCSDPAVPAIEAAEVFRHAVDGIARHGQGQACFLVGGHYAFGEEAAVLLSGLPPVAVIKSGSDQASVLQWALQRMAHELANPSPGNAIVVRHLGHIMLVQVLRIHLAMDHSTPSWLSAISDPRIEPVIQAIHADPARSWTVESLARVAGVSRSTLALRFRQKAGITPLEYVLRWRMQLAARSLKDSQASISSIAQRLGYSSDSAFSSAFKRVMHCAPRRYRQKRATADHREDLPPYA